MSEKQIAYEKNGVIYTRYPPKDANPLVVSRKGGGDTQKEEKEVKERE